MIGGEAPPLAAVLISGVGPPVSASTTRDSAATVGLPASSVAAPSAMEIVTVPIPVPCSGRVGVVRVVSTDPDSASTSRKSETVPFSTLMSSTVKSVATSSNVTVIVNGRVMSLSASFVMTGVGAVTSTSWVFDAPVWFRSSSSAAPAAIVTVTVPSPSGMMRAV